MGVIRFRAQLQPFSPHRPTASSRLGSWTALPTGCIMYAPFAGGRGEHAERFADQAQAAPGGDDRKAMSAAPSCSAGL